MSTVTLWFLLALLLPMSLWANPIQIASQLATMGRAKERARHHDLVITKEGLGTFEHRLQVSDGEKRYILPLYRQREFENRASDLSPKELFFYAEKMGKLRKVSLFEHLQSFLTKKDEVLVVRGQAMALPGKVSNRQLQFKEREQDPKGYLCLLATKSGVKRYKLGSLFSDFVLDGDWSSLLDFPKGDLGELFFTIVVPIVKNGGRDLRYPIHLYVNFLLSTESGEPTEKEVEEIAAKLERVFEDPIHAGKLICKPKELPQIGKLPKWWQSFWEKNGENIGLHPMTTLRLLQKRLGKDYMPKSEKAFRDDVADLLVLTDW